MHMEVSLSRLRTLVIVVGMIGGMVPSRSPTQEVDPEEARRGGGCQGDALVALVLAAVFSR